MKYIRKLPSAEELHDQFYLSEYEIKAKEERIREIKNILTGVDKRKLVIIGPCSADNEKAVLDYADRLRIVAEKIKEKICIIPRIYTGKPRTNGTGYKGILHSPKANAEENLWEGIIAARSMHINVIKETGLYAADEMLYPEELQYTADLLAYLSVGARSVEDQGHRMLASDETIPVGLKNPTAGSKIALLNSIKAAQTRQRMIYMGWEVETEGNPYSHAILRGFTNKSGKNFPNYYYEDLVELHDLFLVNNLCNPGVIIDCNHANSNKKYDEQPRIAYEVLGYCRQNETVDRFVKGLMIESYIEDGCQLLGQGIYGKSITDPCIGWKKTERLLYELGEKV